LVNKEGGKVAHVYKDAHLEGQCQKVRMNLKLFLEEPMRTFSSILLSVALLGCQSSGASKLGMDSGVVAPISGQESQSGSASLVSGKKSEATSSKKSKSQSDPDREKILAARRRAQRAWDLSSTEDSGTYSYPKSKGLSWSRATIGIQNGPGRRIYRPTRPQSSIRLGDTDRRANVKVDGYGYDSQSCTIAPTYKFESVSTPDLKARRDKERQWRPKLNIDLFDGPDKKTKTGKLAVPPKPPQGVLIDAGSR
jgi:hypothetical protein